MESRGIHGLSCRHSAARISRHNMVNDIIWRVLKRATIPVANEPPGLLRSDNKRSDCVTLILWKQGKCLAWDVAMPDTYAQSHLSTTATNVGHVADKSAVSKLKNTRASCRPTCSYRLKQLEYGTVNQQNSSKNLGNVSPLSPGI